MKEVETTHWWYRGLRSMLGQSLRRLDLPPRPTLLDAGCGTGANLRLMRALLPQARFIALDFAPAALQHLEAAENVTVLTGDVNRLPLADAAVDVVFAGDLLGQRGVVVPLTLGHFFRVLKPGGCLLANVPAFEWLRGEHDRAVHVDKRFAPGELPAALRQSGFREVSEHFWNFGPLPLMFVRRTLGRIRPRSTDARSDLTLKPAWLNHGLTCWINAETKLAGQLRLPLGSSLFVVARKSKANLTDPAS